jgi:16S rRNA (guanine527-N7)-methyltransferase
MDSPAPLTPEDFRRQTGIDAATLDRFEAYFDLLKSWQRRINLIGARTLDDVWRRHMLDSAQLFPLVPTGSKSLLDIGSGAGFPGLILAILGVPNVQLVESDGRKCAFLREAARITATEITLHRARIERLKPFAVDTITARACAPLDKLLGLAHGFSGKNTVYLFPKGRNVEQELTESQKKWMMKVSRIKSLTDSYAKILQIEDCQRRDGPRK